MFTALDEKHCSVVGWGIVETSVGELWGGECLRVSSLGMWGLLPANVALTKVFVPSAAALQILSLVSQSLELLHATVHTFVDEVFVSPSTTEVVTAVGEEVTEALPSAILLHCWHTHNWSYPDLTTYQLSLLTVLQCKVQVTHSLFARSS
jgi:hypothetical protein